MAQVHQGGQQPGQYLIPHPGHGLGASQQQQSAAQAFFAKKHHQQHQPRSSVRARTTDDSDDERQRLETLTNYSTILAKCPPPPPATLIKKISETRDTTGQVSGVGKVKVILRVAHSGVMDEKKSSFFKMDKKKKQVTVLAPDTLRESSETVAETEQQHRPLDVSAPKMFAFDGLFTDEDGQNDLSSAALTEILSNVVNGTDGTLFCFGHANLGKSYTMLGSDESSRTVGVIPTAISWLYKCIKERKEKSGARISVRVSAAEIRSLGQEEMRDLLSGLDSGEICVN